MSDFATWERGFRARHPALTAHLPTPLTPLPEVAESTARQGEFTLSAASYLARTMPPERIDRGREMARKYRKTLENIEARIGVPAEIVLAIWGVETDFGRIRGEIPVLAALATLAHAAPRAGYFEAELLAALHLVAEGRVPAEFTGSWAGASGHCQFMPSAVRDYAVGLGGGAGDIWCDDPTDALASIASYLAAHGWQAGGPWLEEAPPERPETLLIPAGLPGPAFRAGANFEVLLSYNRATLYALAVSLLAHAIAGRPVPRDWPDRAPLAREDLRRLQRLLTAAGHDTGGADGLHGPATRAAIRAWQKAHDLPRDGFPSEALLRHVSERASG